MRLMQHRPGDAARDGGLCDFQRIRSRGLAPRRGHEAGQFFDEQVVKRAGLCPVQHGLRHRDGHPGGGQTDAFGFDFVKRDPLPFQFGGADDVIGRGRFPPGTELDRPQRISLCQDGQDFDGTGHRHRCLRAGKATPGGTVADRCLKASQHLAQLCDRGGGHFKIGGALDLHVKRKAAGMNISRLEQAAFDNLHQATFLGVKYRQLSRMPREMNWVMGERR